MMASDRLTFRLSDALRAGLATLAESSGRTESELAREAIAEFVRRHSQRPSCYDLANQAGLIGCVDSGAHDLSTSAKHLRGFGQRSLD